VCHHVSTGLYLLRAPQQKKDEIVSERERERERQRDKEEKVMQKQEGASRRGNRKTWRSRT